MTKIEQIVLLLQEAPDETLDRVIRVLTPEQPEPTVTQELIARRSSTLERNQSMERTITVSVDGEARAYTVIIVPSEDNFIGKVPEIPAISVLSDSINGLMQDLEEAILSSMKL